MSVVSSSSPAVASNANAMGNAMGNADPLFYPFTVAVYDRHHGSQISILTIRLRHILFEEALQEMVDHLRDTLIHPLAYEQCHVLDAYERLVQFFAEGADVEMDGNLAFYDPVELATIMSQFDAMLAFTLYFPASRATRTVTLRGTQSAAVLHDVLRHADLLGEYPCCADRTRHYANGAME